MKPFISWAGGKRRQLNVIENNLPMELYSGKSQNYVEPFAGGGSVFFHILDKFPWLISNVSDINERLMQTYNCVKYDTNKLITALNRIENEYNSLPIASNRRTYFMNCRDKFNSSTRIGHVMQSALFIFLNKTCFNGVYRENKQGKFCGSFGSGGPAYLINHLNFKEISLRTNNTTFRSLHYKESLRFISEDSFVFLDPPYRPLPNKSSFNNYHSSSFDDEEQMELRNFCRKIDSIGAKFMLFNSDPRQNDVNDDFFDRLYSDFNIYRVTARRFVNRNAQDRGPVNEIMVTNYDHREERHGIAA